MGSRDFGFLTLRNIQAFQSNGNPVPSNQVLVTTGTGEGGFTNNLNISTISVHTEFAGYLSTNTIQMNNGEIIGLSTINGVAYSPSGGGGDLEQTLLLGNDANGQSIVGLNNLDMTGDLQVNNTIISQSTILLSNRLRFNFTTNDNTSYIQSGDGTGNQNSSGNLFIGNWLENTTASSRKIMFLANGNVGIGTIHPTTNLQIIGTTSTNNLITSSITTNNLITSSITTNNLITSSITTNNLITSSITTNNSLSITAPNISIIGNLNVTSSLNVTDDLQVSNIVNIRAGSNDTLDDTSGFISQFIRTSSSGTYTIDYQVASDSTGFDFNTWQDARYVYNLENSPPISQVWGIVTSSNITPVGSTIGDIHFYKSVYVDGNVGIGTATPQTTLDIIGNIHTSGYLSTNTIQMNNGEIIGLSTINGVAYSPSGGGGDLEQTLLLGNDANGQSIVGLNNLDMTGNLTIIQSTNEKILIVGSSIGIGVGATTVDAQKCNPGIGGISIGAQSTIQTQGPNCISIGAEAGNNNQGHNSVAVGVEAGSLQQGENSVALGFSAGFTQQGNRSVAIGGQAGNKTQGDNSVAIGFEAGNITQGINCVSIGGQAGNDTQGDNSVAVGVVAGSLQQGENSVAIGFSAGFGQQGINSVAIGNSAGQNSQGNTAIAIGNFAGETSQHASTIILNATGSALNSDDTVRFFVKPIRDEALGIGVGVMKYNPITGEITYSTT
jgi:hypothetical protein